MLLLPLVAALYTERPVFIPLGFSPSLVIILLLFFPTGRQYTDARISTCTSLPQSRYCKTISDQLSFRFSSIKRFLDYVQLLWINRSLPTSMLRSCPQVRLWFMVTPSAASSWSRLVIQSPLSLPVLLLLYNPRLCLNRPPPICLYQFLLKPLTYISTKQFKFNPQHPATSRS